MNTMQSMELTEDESFDAAMPIPMPDKPDYPYGLQICLTAAEIEKLGIDPTEATIGGVFHFEAMARVTSVSASSGEMGDSFRMEAQITDMSVIGEDVPPKKRGLAAIYKS